MAKMSVEDSSLTAVANAIRTKGETTDPLTFPDGFVSAINDISAGGENYLLGMVDGSIVHAPYDMLIGCKQIREYAFNACTKLESVSIPESVTSIGSGAFRGCQSLKNLVIPEGVSVLNNSVCQSCAKLESVSIPESVTSIGNYAFNSCYKITSIVIPKLVTSIGSNVFAGDISLESITMKPITPPKLGAYSFTNCSSLSAIFVPAGSLSAYQSATNWSEYADIMMETS